MGHFKVNRMKRAFKVLPLAFLTLIACSRTYRIPEKYLELNPYGEKDVLVFKSNRGEYDSLFIVGSGSYISENDPLDASSDKEETYYVNSKDDLRDSFVSKIITLRSTEEEGLILEINFTSENARFYGPRSFKVKKLDDLTINEIEINDRKYNDVWLFYGSDLEYVDRDNFIEKIYWSKRHGVIRYDKKNGEYWELMDIISK